MKKQTSQESSRFYTVLDLARILDLTPKRVRDLLKEDKVLRSGTIQTKNEGEFRILRIALAEWLHRRRLNYHLLQEQDLTLEEAAAEFEVSKADILNKVKENLLFTIEGRYPIYSLKMVLTLEGDYSGVDL